MKLIYDLDKIIANNGGNFAPCPHMPINGYSGGFALMLSDGTHEGICFAGFETKNQAIESAEKCPALHDGWHLYILHANGHDLRNPSHIRWELRAECIF